jgi:hypothetical protein
LRVKRIRKVFFPVFNTGSFIFSAISGIENEIEAGLDSFYAIAVVFHIGYCFVVFTHSVRSGIVFY